MTKKELFKATTLIAFVLITISSFAQVDKSKLKKTSLFIGPRISVTAADLADNHSWGLGVHSQVAHYVGEKTAVTGTVSYTYLFGKSSSSSTYVPGGGNYEGSHKSKGMSDVGISGGIRKDLNNRFSLGGEVGLCLDFFHGENETSGMGLVELLYSLGNSPGHMLAAFLSICGDPKIQIGVRYAIRL